MTPAEDQGVAGRSALLVLGMHRSGTSALSGVLAHMGCAAPRTLMEGEPDNPRGFFESRRVGVLNHRILKACGSSWHDWRPLDLPAPDTPEGAAFRDDAAILIEEEFGGADHILLKDPRICRLFPVWSDGLARRGYRPAIVLTHRSPYEVARSLQARDAFPLAYGLLLWLRHVLDAERATRGRPRAVTSYDRVLTDWRGAVAGIGDRLGLTFPRTLGAAGPEVDAFLSAELRHHAGAPGEPLHPVLAGLVDEAFAILERWASGGEDGRDHAALDRLRASLGGASWAFAEVPGVAAALASARASVARLEQRLLDEARRSSEAGRLLAESQGAVEAALARDRDHALERDRQTRELAALARLLRDAEEQLEVARRAQEEAERHLRAIIESSSWRLTAPMRRVADRLRRR